MSLGPNFAAMIKCASPRLSLLETRSALPFSSAFTFSKFVFATWYLGWRSCLRSELRQGRRASLALGYCQAAPPGLERTAAPDPVAGRPSLLAISSIRALLPDARFRFQPLVFERIGWSMVGTPEATASKVGDVETSLEKGSSPCQAANPQAAS